MIQCPRVNTKEFHAKTPHFTAPWKIESVDLDMEAKKVEVRVTLASGTRLVRKRAAAHDQRLQRALLEAPRHHAARNHDLGKGAQSHLSKPKDLHGHGSVSREQYALDAGLRGARRLAVDEKQWRGGRAFTTFLNDLNEGRVPEVTEGRSAESGKEAFHVLRFAGEQECASGRRRHVASLRESSP